MTRGGLITAGVALAILVGVPLGRWEWIRIQAPHDLAFDSVEVRRMAVARDGKHEIFDNMLVVNFRSHTDLQTLARKYGLHLHVTASACNDNHMDPKRELFFHWKGSPADDYGEVDVWSYDEAANAYRTRPSGRRDASGTIRYRFVSYIRLTGTILPELYHYDLIETPVQLCAILEGSNDLLGEVYLRAFTTNVIIIPKQSVVDAVSRAHLQ